MPLTNFGAILNFAETLEQGDMEFYQSAAAAATPAQRAVFDDLARQGRKLTALVQRTRRENVTEMILEPVRDFVRDGYQVAVGDAAGMDPEAILGASMALEQRAIRYYNDAAQKLRALPEVARALNTLAKKRALRLDQLQRLGG